jgi:hypothetical protein
MNMTFAALALVAASFTTETTQTLQDRCQAIGNLAEGIMMGRQRGISMSHMMGVAGDMELARLLVIEAYDVPRMSMPENQRREVEDFRNMVESICYKGQ